jgi:alkanesulfonate monooxygenase SsuD/methylene tetrahydromethanopterin reductase-like flavin-dependent oxidoreductase (luciferase family)
MFTTHSSTAPAYGEPRNLQAVRIGLALPQYDYSIAGESPLRWETLLSTARRAASAGFESLWLSDHLFFDISKYGGPSEPAGAFEPLVTLAALARAVEQPRLGVLVFCEALRPASVLAKALATLDRVSGGRLEVGLGAGWYEPEYSAIGMEMPPPGVRVTRLAEAVQIVAALLASDGAPVSFDGTYHRAAGARVLPPAQQHPRPPVLVGGKGDRIIRTAVQHADGWNTCWAWTREQYRERLDVVEAECERAGRDPASFRRTLGLYALCGEDRGDLERRFDRLRANTPPGVLDGVTLDDWRVGRLVGTVAEVREQVAGWEGLGVEEIVVGAGAVPFHLGSADDLDALAEALL